MDGKGRTLDLVYSDVTDETGFLDAIQGEFDKGHEIDTIRVNSDLAREISKWASSGTGIGEVMFYVSPFGKHWIKPVPKYEGSS